MEGQKMKKLELKSIVSEALNELIHESAPPGFPKALSDKIKAEYPNSPEFAYATMWKIAHKKSAGDKKITKMWETWEKKREVGEDATPKKDTNKQIADLLSKGNKVFSGAMGRVGQVLKVDNNGVLINTPNGRKGVTSFNSGDPVDIQPSKDGSYTIVNTESIQELGGMIAGVKNRAESVEDEGVNVRPVKRVGPKVGTLEGALPPDGPDENIKEGLGDWAGWGKITEPQKSSEDKMSRAGFRYTHHFPADSGDDPEQKMVIIMQRKKGPSTYSGEIEPDGTVSGEPVDVFISNFQKRGLREHDETNMRDPEEKREVKIGKQILQLCANGEKIAGTNKTTYNQISILAEELIRMHGVSITEINVPAKTDSGFSLQGQIDSMRQK